MWMRWYELWLQIQTQLLILGAILILILRVILRLNQRSENQALEECLMRARGDEAIKLPGRTQNFFEELVGS